EVKGPNAEFLFLGYRFPGAGSEDAQLLNLMANILTNGSAGLIDLNLVKSQKLLGAGAFPYVLKDYSLLILQGNPSQGQSLEDVQALLLAEIEKRREGEFSDELITSIINNERKYRISGINSYKNRAQELMSAFTSEIDWADEVGYTDRLAHITKQDVVDFANKYLNDRNYVVVYKRQGVDENVVKVEKPAITPITVNRNDQSDFLKTVNAMPEEAIQPVWVDYEREVQKGKLRDLDIVAVQNKENALFSLSYQYPIGKWDNKLLPLAVGYLEFLGTKEKSSEDFSRAFYKLASDFSVSAGNEETRISISALGENLDQTVLLIQDLLRNCVVDEAAFQAYISRYKKARANAKENKGSIMEGLRAYAKYGAQNPFNYTFSDQELDQVKAEDLVTLLHGLVRTKHTILYYGPEDVRSLATKLPSLKSDNKPYLTIQKGPGFK